MENRAEFLKQDRITKRDIVDRILVPQNYDGLRANSDLEALVREE